MRGLYRHGLTAWKDRQQRRSQTAGPALQQSAPGERPLSSEGAAKTAMCALMAGAVLNVILDPVFIYALNLGVAGAAIATAISQIISTLVKAKDDQCPH